MSIKKLWVVSRAPQPAGIDVSAGMSELSAHCPRPYTVPGGAPCPMFSAARAVNSPLSRRQLERPRSAELHQFPPVHISSAPMSVPVRHSGRIGTLGALLNSQRLSTSAVDPAAGRLGHRPGGEWPAHPRRPCLRDCGRGGRQPQKTADGETRQEVRNRHDGAMLFPFLSYAFVTMRQSNALSYRWQNMCQ